MNNAQAKIIEVARSHVGLCACKFTRDAFRVAIGGGPWDLSKPFKVNANGTVQGVSTCGLFTWRCAQVAWGSSCPWDKAWKVSQPIDTIAVVARIKGLWCVANGIDKPSPGSIILNSHHVAIVEVCEAGKLTTISAGQNCYQEGKGHQQLGLQMIKRKTQTLASFDALGWLDASLLADI